MHCLPHFLPLTRVSCLMYFTRSSTLVFYHPVLCLYFSPTTFTSVYNKGPHFLNITIGFPPLLLAYINSANSLGRALASNLRALCPRPLQDRILLTLYLARRSASVHNFYTPAFLLQCLRVIQSGCSVLYLCFQLTNDIWIIGCAIYSNYRGLDIFRLQNLSLNVE